MNTEFEWTDIKTDTSIFTSNYVGIKCPQCGLMSLARNKKFEEYCTVCSYDKREKRNDS